VLGSSLGPSPKVLALWGADPKDLFYLPPSTEAVQVVDWRPTGDGPPKAESESLWDQAGATAGVPARAGGPAAGPGSADGWVVRAQAGELGGGGDAAVEAAVRAARPGGRVIVLQRVTGENGGGGALQSVLGGSAGATAADLDRWSTLVPGRGFNWTIRGPRPDPHAVGVVVVPELESADDNGEAKGKRRAKRPKSDKGFRA